MALRIKAAAMLAVILSLSVPALAHDAASGMEYDSWCCDGDGKTGDCQRIPASSVLPVDGGWQVTLAPGQHRLVTEPHTYFVQHGKEKRSRDGEYHACLWPTEKSVRCLYTPPMGF